MKLSEVYPALCALPIFVSAVLSVPFNTAHELSARTSTSTCTLDPPAGAICGETGYGGRFIEDLDSRQFLSLDTCARWCADQNVPELIECKRFSHDIKTNICTIYGLSRRFFPAANSTKVFYDQECFTCTSDDCNISPNINLLNNPGFAISNRFVGPWLLLTTGDPLATKLVPYNGQMKGLSFIVSSRTAPNEGTVGQYRRVCQDQSYRIRIDYKVEQITKTPPNNSYDAVDNIRIGLSGGDCHPSRTFTLDDPGLGTWNFFDCSTSGDDQIQFFFDAAANDGSLVPQVSWNVTMANAQLTRLPSGMLKTKGPELVTNGGFESGALAPWKFASETLKGLSFDYYPPSGDVVPSDPCTPGAPLFNISTPGSPSMGPTQSSNFAFRACVMNSFDYSPNKGNVYFALSQPIPATAFNTDYVLTLEYNVSGGSTPGNFIGLDILFNQDVLSLGSDIIIDGNAHIFQKLFSGFGKGGNLTFVFTTGGPDPPGPQLSAAMDNISLRQLDDS